MPADGRTWIDRFAEVLGLPELAEEDVEVLLRIASVAAHASERSAAPVSCWLAAASGVSIEEALRRAERLGDELSRDS